jgi:glucose/arabinose dehydrogenase
MLFHPRARRPESETSGPRRADRHFHGRVEALERRDLPTSLPGGFTDTLVAGGLTEPTAMEIAPDGRIFVAEQTGSLRVVKDGNLLPRPALTVDVNSSGERGLLGVALDPNFADDHFVYVYYTVATAPVHNRISRFTMSGDAAVAGSEVVLLDLDNLSSATNHNGGAIHFGPDGKLYVGVGENANGPNAQSLANLLGKVLRINTDGSIPGDNPFVNTATGKNRAIWALGLRNPFTFAFQPGTGRLFINDVGQNTWEEIDEGIAGSNYGWPATEGPTTDPRFRPPLFAYGHGPGDTLGIAIAGGAFYNSAHVQFPSTYVSSYFFADLGNDWIRNFDAATNTVNGFATDLPAGPVDLKVDAAGSLYYLARGDGSSTGVVGRIDFPAGVDPTPSPTPTPTSTTDVAPVLVMGTRVRAVRGLVQGIDLTFSDAVDSGHAAMRENYRLTLPGADRTFGTRDDRPIRVRRIVVGAGADSVRLVVAGRLSSRLRFRLVVDGSHPTGITDRSGQAIDGDADGQKGGDFVTILRRMRDVASKAAISARIAG